jgi:hypothetical protein
MEGEEKDGEVKRKMDGGMERWQMNERDRVELLTCKFSRNKTTSESSLYKMVKRTKTKEKIRKENKRKEKKNSIRKSNNQITK